MLYLLGLNGSVSGSICWCVRWWCDSMHGTECAGCMARTKALVKPMTHVWALSGSKSTEWFHVWLWFKILSLLPNFPWTLTLSHANPSWFVTTVVSYRELGRMNFMIPALRWCPCDLTTSRGSRHFSTNPLETKASIYQALEDKPRFN